VSQFNNSATFSGKTVRSERPEAFLNRLVEALGIIILDRRPKGSPLKMKS